MLRKGICLNSIYSYASCIFDKFENQLFILIKILKYYGVFFVSHFVVSIAIEYSQLHTFTENIRIASLQTSLKTSLWGYKAGWSSTGSNWMSEILSDGLGLDCVVYVLEINTQV